MFKEQHDLLYWKQRCEAAEEVLALIPLNGNEFLPSFGDKLKEWQTLKQQTHG